LFPEEGSSRYFAEVSYRAGLLAAFVFAVIGVFHVALQIGLGEDAFPERSAYPTLFGRPGRFAGWKLGALIGVVAAFASAPVFWLLGAELGPSIDWLRELAPGYASVPVAIQYSIALPAMAGIAVTEEILFRGVIQQWIVRMRGGGRGTVVAAIVLTSAFWALGHVGNVDPAWFKVSQIFVLGLIFGALAHRHGVESSCVAHACLNVTATIVGAGFEWSS
jgi:membrane protease YdiL (CAAX protease family)